MTASISRRRIDSWQLLWKTTRSSWRRVGAARERAVETVRGNLAAKSARGGLEEYRRALDAEFEGTIDALTASMGMTASPDQKNTFNSAFDAFAAANASIYKSSADFRRECVDLLAKRALAELGSPRARRFRCA